jgi:hypothetical protein
MKQTSWREMRRLQIKNFLNVESIFRKRVVINEVMLADLHNVKASNKEIHTI